MYKFGRGVSQDYSKAAEYITKTLKVKNSRIYMYLFEYRI